ncbi:hypothetical protein Cri9333_3344 [Crinalium epipsammum PCC 9333]|uniref:Glycerol kinase n=1 Tax=Crinalium epipsammum PCC 9333 TaxID=1173022 RepID=K9W304_9CYAN|nr:hypothetical protein [Crinalium epipsammum]AFZ14174.1 hypothetical protein Cri9333_3344 [Crinalium epipsammum PCC 9333]
MSLEPSIFKLVNLMQALSSSNAGLNCTTPGCNQQVSKPGYKLCYNCWKVNNTQQFIPKPKPQHQTASSSSLLSATTIGEKLGIPKNKINSILAELGLLSKDQNGWIATKRGIAFGAVQKIHSQENTPYVLWSESILTNQVFLTTLESIRGNNSEVNKTEVSTKQGFREKFQGSAQHRTTDGHLVRSKAEVLIDNWLYMSGLVHAYERRLPIEEEVYCDFYIPSGKVYIEYWGYNNDPDYVARKKIKQDLYQKYELNLIELDDEHIKNLDDYMPQMLLKFGIVVN